MSPNLDVDDSIMAATTRSSIFYGQVNYSARHVMLAKGQGKIPFTDGMDPADRRTDLELVLNPLDEMHVPRLIQRSVIAESREFGSIVWPSLHSCGLTHIKDLHGKFAKVELVPTGRVYQGRGGGDIEATTFKFLALYASHEECLAAYRADVGSQPEASQPETNDQSAGNEAERQVALRFLPSIVKGANGDLVALETTLASMSPINKYFTVDSPEVQALLRGQP